jgi:predicted RNA binding protein YcfA (HicA-like mRNA interferase family)
VSEIPSLSYKQIISTLQRLGFIVIRQKGSHIRLQKRILDKVVKITVPAHRPVNPNTLRHILKQADIEIETFKENL